MLLLVILLLALPAPAAAQSADSVQVTVRSFSEDVMDAYRRNPAYQYERRPPPWMGWWQRAMSWIDEYVFNVPEGVQTGRVLKWLIYLLAVGGIVYAVARLFRIDPSGLTRKAAPASQGVEMALAADDVTGTDFERLIDEAVGQRQYRRAVRLQYLQTLGEMDRLGLVRREREKTNYDYLRELHGAELRDSFRWLTRFFEHVWYGHRAVPRAQYDRIASAFRTFRERLG